MLAKEICRTSNNGVIREKVVFEIKHLHKVENYYYSLADLKELYQLIGIVLKDEEGGEL
jgi:hypothetical protein